MINQKNRLPTWRAEVRLKALIISLGWCLIGVISFYGGSLLPEKMWLRPFIQAIGGTCISIVLVTVVTYVFGDSIAKDLLNLFQEALTNESFLSTLTHDSKSKVARNLLTSMVSWCSEPIFEFIIAAPFRKNQQIRSQPRHEWDLSDLPKDIECEFRSGRFTFRRSSYFRIQLQDEFLSNTDLFEDDLLALFFFEDTQKSQEQLRKSFNEPANRGRVIFRDVLFFEENDVELLNSLISSSEPSNPSSSHPLGAAIKIKLRVHFRFAGTDSMPSTSWEMKDIEPDEAVWDSGLKLIWSRSKLPSALATLPDDAQVRIEMFIEFPIYKHAGFYPIIFSSFARNPEVIVNFRTAEPLALKEVVPFLVSADPRKFQLHENEDGSRLRLAAGESPYNLGAWLFPGSGIAIRWRSQSAKPRALETSDLPTSTS